MSDHELECGYDEYQGYYGELIQPLEILHAETSTAWEIQKLLDIGAK